jgi:hypothetical protein
METFQLTPCTPLGIRGAFIGEFAVADHPVAEGDIIAEGRDYWDTVFNMVTFGKFFLRFGPSASARMPRPRSAPTSPAGCCTASR